MDGGRERGAAPVHSHEPTGQTKCLLADECEKSECPLIAESSVSQIPPTASRRPLTSHFAVRVGFPSYLVVDFFPGGGGMWEVFAPAPSGVSRHCRFCVRDGVFFFYIFFVAGAGAAGRWRVPEIN